MQTDTIADLPDATAVAARHRPTPWHALGITLGLGISADLLLLGYLPGISLPLFLVAVAFCAVVSRKRSELADARTLILAGSVLLTALVPLVENLSPLSVAIGLCGLCLFTLMITGSLVPSVAANLRNAAALLFSGPFTFLPTVAVACGSAAAHRRVNGSQWVTWVLPIGLGVVFLLLFQAANPIIDAWLHSIDFLAMLDNIDFGRVLFIVAMMTLCWPFLQSRTPATRFHLFRRTRNPAVQNQPAVDAGIKEKSRTDAHSGLFGRTAILRSLVLFNALFAVQTALDLTYLWGGRALPGGMSFAGYAHRGAYPLVVTALIAAGFTLIAMRPGSQTEQFKPIRNLVLLWTGQNVLLVISSIFRLDLYIGAYSLTMLRLEAFVWMGLVAVGLTLIMARIFFNRSNAWLIKWNLISLVLTLYICSLVNIPAFIARYNIEHSAEMSGDGVPLDIGYLISLGPQVIPALDRYRLLRSAQGEFESAHLEHEIYCLEYEFGKSTGNWRSWTFRDARLKYYLHSQQHLWP
ncbi:DUF4173 domain-containing protein [Hoeflea sp. TYP-13]|uniref:DUF4173 domain-containing protein n=1 Tax=Hoeflea sp. TYP-13 TaxID=3230023 RepID=UPI0034C5D2AD